MFLEGGRGGNRAGSSETPEVYNFQFVVPPSGGAAPPEGGTTNFSIHLKVQSTFQTIMKEAFLWNIFFLKVYSPERFCRRDSFEEEFQGDDISRAYACLPPLMG